MLELHDDRDLDGQRPRVDHGENEKLSVRPASRHSFALTPVASRPSHDRPSFHQTVSRTSHVDGHGYFSDDGRNDGQDVEQQVTIEDKDENPFEVGWDGPEDPMNPKNMKVWRKWMIVVINAFGALCVTCTSSLYTVTYGEHTTRASTSP